jgi:hypothetical protein
VLLRDAIARGLDTRIGLEDTQHADGARDGGRYLGARLSASQPATSATPANITMKGSMPVR